MYDIGGYVLDINLYIRIAAKYDNPFMTLAAIESLSVRAVIALVIELNQQS